MNYLDLKSLMDRLNDRVVVDMKEREARAAGFMRAEPHEDGLANRVIDHMGTE